MLCACSECHPPIPLLHTRIGCWRVPGSVSTLQRGTGLNTWCMLHTQITTVLPCCQQGLGGGECYWQPLYQAYGGVCFVYAAHALRTPPPTASARIGRWRVPAPASTLQDTCDGLAMVDKDKDGRRGVGCGMCRHFFPSEGCDETDVYCWSSGACNGPVTMGMTCIVEAMPAAAT